MCTPHAIQQRCSVRFGPPHHVQRQHDGDLYTWRRKVDKARSIVFFPMYAKVFKYGTSSSSRDDLALLFDTEGVLLGMGLRLETEED